jgi:ferredoxin
MSEDSYLQLARRLDAIPNGFPQTESGVELRLLAKIFAPEEAALACQMSQTPEPAAAIAARASVDAKEARRRLKQMVRKGLITARRGEGQLVFALMPFVVGFYEEQLPHMDEELALLFEQYLQESMGGPIIGYTPSVNRVIPVEEAIPFSLEVHPYERASELLENAKSWGVRDCICRVQQKLIGKGCDRPVGNCLLFAPAEGAFRADGTTRPVSKAEALELLHQAEEAGLVHTTGNYRDGHTYICNCCTCCCGVLRGVAEFGIPTAVAHSDFRAVVDPAVCSGCGTCLDRCQFDALALADDVCSVDPVRCVGCGLCTSACDAGALRLDRRPSGETPPTPASAEEWLAERARAREMPF